MIRNSMQMFMMKFKPYWSYNWSQENICAKFRKSIITMFLIYYSSFVSFVRRTFHTDVRRIWRWSIVFWHAQHRRWSIISWMLIKMQYHAARTGNEFANFLAVEFAHAGARLLTRKVREHAHVRMSAPFNYSTQKAYVVMHTASWG